MVENMYLFKNFTVKEYKQTDKFRCLLKDIQVVFSTDSKIELLEGTDILIEHDVFDFYEMGDLKNLAKKITYLDGKVSILFYELNILHSFHLVQLKI